MEITKGLSENLGSYSKELHCFQIILQQVINIPLHKVDFQNIPTHSQAGLGM
jgi:hypothetical protein